jgi:hypothetical protein
MPVLQPPLNNSRESNVPLVNSIHQRLLVRLTNDTFFGHFRRGEVLSNVFQSAGRQDGAKAMTSRVLSQDNAVLKVCRHMFCADKRRDGIGDIVDEEDWIPGFGLIEAWVC